MKLDLKNSITARGLVSVNEFNTILKNIVDSSYVGSADDSLNQVMAWFECHPDWRTNVDLVHHVRAAALRRMAKIESMWNK